MKGWVVKESGFQKNYVRKYESIMCQGNGYMGVRAATDENYEKNIRCTWVAGTFDKTEGKNTNELPNAADTTAVFLTADGIPLNLTQENVKDYKRSLLLYNGLLERSFTWKPRKGLCLAFRSERFVSLQERHVLGQRVLIRVLEGSATLELQSGILGGERCGNSHFTAMQGYVQDGIMQYAETTYESKITFVTSAVVKTWIKDSNGKENAVEMAIHAEKERVMSSCRVVLQQGQELCLEKICRIVTTRDEDVELADEDSSKPGRDFLLCREKAEMKKLCERGYRKIWERSQKCWKQLWQKRDVEISGKVEYDQLAVRFAIYHLTIMTPHEKNVWTQDAPFFSLPEIDLNIYRSEEKLRAYQLFVESRDTDLCLRNNSDYGVHTTSLGVIWQSCVLGFAGVRICNEKLYITPNLPDNWERVTFRLWWRESQLKVTVTKDNVDVKVLKGPKDIEVITE
ncbi:MAG: hypothetical protein IJ439_06440 [Tyzzerella sp.]|nr:hypothetical protein [Tyzzerella sp.]